MNNQQWAALEKRIEALMDSHGQLRDDKHKLQVERQKLLDLNQELQQRIKSVLERVKKLELEADL